VRLLPAGASSAQPRPPLTDQERDLLERLLIAEREFANLRAREARLTEAVRWAAHSSRGLGLTDVADMLETLIRQPDT
jgi:hypothetical protein